MTIEKLQALKDELTQAIHYYKEEPNYDETKLEMLIDDLLCKLPQDIVYVEWFDRSQIKDMADGVYDEPVENEDLIDKCMEDLDRFNGSIMENETVEQIVADTIRNNKEGASYED